MKIRNRILLMAFGAVVPLVLSMSDATAEMGEADVVLPGLGDVTAGDDAMPVVCDVDICKHACKLVWEYDERQCDKIDPEKRKERERCHRRANEAYARCIVDCEKDERC